LSPGQRLDGARPRRRPRGRRQPAVDDLARLHGRSGEGRPASVHRSGPAAEPGPARGPGPGRRRAAPLGTSGVRYRAGPLPRRPAAGRAGVDAGAASESLGPPGAAVHRRRAVAEPAAGGPAAGTRGAAVLVVDHHVAAAVAPAVPAAAPAARGPAARSDPRRLTGPERMGRIAPHAASTRAPGPGRRIEPRR